MSIAAALPDSRPLERARRHLTPLAAGLTLLIIVVAVVAAFPLA